MPSIEGTQYVFQEAGVVFFGVGIRELATPRCRVLLKTMVRKRELSFFGVGIRELATPRSRILLKTKVGDGAENVVVIRESRTIGCLQYNTET